MKFADILCEEPLAQPCSGAGSTYAWPDSLSSAKSHIHDASPDRRHRSRSSPVRGEETWKQEGRGHSPSSSAAAAARSMRAHALQAAAMATAMNRYSLGYPCLTRQNPRYCLENNGNTDTGRTGFDRVSAYYSMRPPLMPLQLVPVAPPIPPALATDSSSPPMPNTAVARHLEQERCKDEVHDVVCDLSPGFPLSTASSPARHPTLTHPLRPAPPVPSAHMAIVPTLPGHAHYNSSGTPLPSSAGSSDGIGRRRVAHHVGTQARATRSVRSDEGIQERAEPADEWLGGVRALRDSHVRLVLRQLRHIDRLNRALDRATRFPLPTHNLVKTPATTVANVIPANENGASALQT